MSKLVNGLAVLILHTIPCLAADCLMPGDVCRLSPDAAIKGIVLSADSLKYCEEMLKSIRLNDNDGLKELVMANHLYATRGGDGIRLLTVKSFSDCGEGRMTTGEYKSMRVWTFKKWIVK